MTNYHKHHDCIIEWAKGAKIQTRHSGYSGDDVWVDIVGNPTWNIPNEYRVKPEPKYIYGVSYWRHNSAEMSYFQAVTYDTLQLAEAFKADLAKRADVSDINIVKKEIHE